MIFERFAPSPTGPLHLGHAYSAYLGWKSARQAGGKFLVRLEDLDAPRVRPEWEAAIAEDLAWLGIDWDGPVLKQSMRIGAYHAALQKLSDAGLTFFCRCARRDIQQATSAPQEGAVIGPDGIVYPGTCRNLGLGPAAGTAVRLNMQAAIAALGGPVAVRRLAFTEVGERTGRSVHLDPEWLIQGVGDVVLARRDGAVAYHLAVVLDDDHQDVTHVTRGSDLFDATSIHRLLQALLGLKTPVYRHHALVRDADGKRLAKRDDARAIARYRADGLSPKEVLALAASRAGPCG